MKRFDNHTHTHKSNIQHRDSTNFESALIDRALELDLAGISITDHACLSSHVDALLHLEKLKNDKSKSLKEIEKINNFKLGLGTEIYLIHREEIKKAREANEKTKFYHLVLVAKNKDGYRALAELSSEAWRESFYFRGVERIPTYYDYFEVWAKKNKGNILVSSACLGSEFSHLVLAFANENSNENRENIIKYLEKMVSLFGEDFYIEIQPSKNEEQIIYNKLAIQIGVACNIKTIITTDSHYLSKEKKEVHSIFLRSQDAERETEAFYSSTYLMNSEELYEYFEYLDKETFESFLSNSLDLANKITDYSLFHKIEVPKTTIKLLNKKGELNKIDTKKYEYIEKFKTSSHSLDHILLEQIEIGLENKKIILNENILDRLNRELEALWEISEKLEQRLASYYLLTKEVVEIMWTISLVGVSRGSAGAFYISYLLDICQINPIEYDLPEWRHIDASKVELADVDLDSEAGQRVNILEKIKEKFGHSKVLNIATFKTEGSSSAIQTMCRGMGIPTEEAAYLASLVVEGKSVKKCLETVERDSEAKKLIKEMMRFEGLVENVIEIEGLVCGRSVHASGVYIFCNDYWKYNACMKAPKGQLITQYDMSCSDYQGGLKLDFLTVESLDRIRKCLDLMIEDEIIKKESTLKKTYEKYLHPDILNKNNEKMWEDLNNGNILDAFQYDSPQGKNAIAKIRPNNFQELMSGNALMRLTCEGEQPIDKYVKHKNSIQIWYDNMMENGLNQNEIETMKDHLLKSYGVAATQESVMRISMDQRVANFNLVQANKLRKAIAKSKAKHMIEEVYKLFIKNGIENGNREVFLNYVWENHVVPQLG